jgi:putative nucleotidyltransferase with HDIG domain
MSFHAEAPYSGALSVGGLRLAEVLSALSHALDITEGQPEGHCVRCCWIGMQMAADLGLDTATRQDIYYTILLKDAGCSSNAARICALYLTDDLAFKSDFKRIDGSLAEALRFVLDHTGLKAGLAERFRAIFNILRNGGSISRELIETRCQRGADIALKMRFSETVAAGIRALDEHWDGSGKPQGLTGGAIPIASGIALLAQIADVFLTARGLEAARGEVKHRAGSWFDPALAASFERISARPGFAEALAAGDLQVRVLDMEPGRQHEAVDADYLDDIAAAFAQVVDSKSPYTSGHSARVTLYADLIAAELGLGDAHRRWMKRAALLHDIGKLGVSNTILDKPGKLDDAEWAEMKKHPAHSRRILARIGAFADLAVIAGAHHERLDGRGYPDGLAGAAIPLDARIIAVADVFDALTADRPYRRAMSIEAAFGILEREIGAAFDGDCVAALRRGIARPAAAAA